ncbi:unnamed protein product [Pseudo-nitzschia multistriata]|uniref:Lipase maturation factor n=1 Tax=Pseudo-nitzschia multistriata TaxID=183589 RepID=A0A448Z592_9STRA|nr:unnamed protein product [Pseudo-nitzschia multistriata]
MADRNKESSSNTAASDAAGETYASRSDIVEEPLVILSDSDINDNNQSKSTSTVTHAGLSYAVSGRLVLGLLGCMYFLAFYGAYQQWEGLMGSHGLNPVYSYLETQRKKTYGCTINPKSLLKLENYYSVEQFSNCLKGFVDHPSLFWFFEHSDRAMRTLVLSGMTLSALCILGSTSMALMVALWLSYFSIVTSAEMSSFYAYGWESQLLETGFLAIFLCQNWLLPHRLAASDQPAAQPEASPLVWYLFRWLCFRISIGAGMIKIRGDSCWTQKTCLLYHFETQPIPSPLSFVFHFLPQFVLKRAVDLDLFVQVYTSWFVLLPTTNVAPSSLWSKASLVLVRLGGWIQAGFMINIALSGNMSMLNHLTIIPALACLDDNCYPVWIRRRFSGLTAHNNKTAEIGMKDDDTVDISTESLQSHRWRWTSFRLWIDVGLFMMILVLSKPTVENLLQLNSRQAMNASFDSFRLVNTYGAFGSVGKQRFEPIVSIAYKINQAGDDGKEPLEWIEIEFPCKPGSIHRRPCFCAPYHYRLDWNIWFIGFPPHDYYLNRREKWLYILLLKILGMEGSKQPTTKTKPTPPWLNLLDPVSVELLKQRGPPLYAKVDMYHYEMAAPLWKIASEYFNGVFSDSSKDGGYKIQWWNRYFKENLVPVVTVDGKRDQLYLASA